MFARYTNPHTLNDTGRTVTRHDLYHDEDTLMNDDPVEPDVTELKELDRMILQSIGLSDNGLPILSASATHTHEPRAKKRRKTHEEDRDVVPFRLLSSAKHPAPLNLGPKPWIRPEIVREAAAEDDEKTAALRAAQAAAVAVDIDWIYSQSRMAPAPRSRNVRPAVAFHVHPNHQHGPLAVFEVARETKPKRRIKLLQGHERPSPHELTDPLLCPIVPVSHHISSSV